MKAIAAASFLCLCLTSNARAQEAVTCHEFPHVVVVERIIGDSVGTDFIIKWRSDVKEQIRCEYVRGERDFELKDAWPEYYLDLKGNLLILDSGKGAMRGIDIWNIDSRSRVYTSAYSELLEVHADAVEFWTEAEPATDVHCKGNDEWAANGLPATAEARVILKLPELKLIRTADTRCVPRRR
jgi:hypothetical protein